MNQEATFLVLACYPRAFRHENEVEVLAVLVSSAGAGQRRVGLTESAALIRGALRMRVRLAWANGRRQDWARLVFLGRSWPYHWQQPVELAAA